MIEQLGIHNVPQFSSLAQSCPTLCDPVDCSVSGFPVHHQLRELAQTRWVGDAIQPSHSLSSPSSPAFNLSQHQGLFKSVTFSHQVATKHWSFSFNISPSNEHPGLILISFRMDWLDLLAIQGTLKSLLQHHSSKASILRCSAFFTVQLSHPYMTTGKTIALTRWPLVGKVMSLLLNILSRLVITFLPRSKCLLISWLQLPYAVYIYSCSSGTLFKKILAYFFGCLGSSLWHTDFSQIAAHRLSSCCVQA